MNTPSVSHIASGTAAFVLGDKERKVFSVIEFEAETRLETLARKLKMQPANLNYTIRRMLNAGLLKPQCFINSFRLGLMDIGFYFSLAEQRALSKKKLIERFQTHPNVAYFGSVLGDFQYVAVILCSSLHEFSKIITDLTNNSDDLVSDKQIVPRLAVTRYARKYIFPKLASSKTFTLKSDGNNYQMDLLDEQIIMAIGNRPYESLRELARFLGSPLATVDRRLKNLKKEGVVQGTFYNLDVSRLGIQSFRVLVQVQGLSCAVRQAIQEFCATQIYVTYLVEALGNWDFEIGIETFDPRTISEVIEELHTISGHRIAKTQVLMELDDYMCRHYPGKMGGGAPRA